MRSVIYLLLLCVWLWAAYHAYFVRHDVVMAMLYLVIGALLTVYRFRRARA